MPAVPAIIAGIGALGSYAASRGGGDSGGRGGSGGGGILQDTDLRNLLLGQRRQTGQDANGTPIWTYENGLLPTQLNQSLRMDPLHASITSVARSMLPNFSGPSGMTNPPGGPTGPTGIPGGVPTYPGPSVPGPGPENPYPEIPNQMQSSPFSSNGPQMQGLMGAAGPQAGGAPSYADLLQMMSRR